MNFNKKKMWPTIMYFAGLGFIMFVFLFLLTTTVIGYGVKERCVQAQSRYEGDCVEALIEYVDDDNNDFRSRNSAIWALGQLGDKRAATTLNKYYTGYNDGRSKVNEDMSQYELSKATKLVEGDFNITSPFWQYGVAID